MLIHATRLVELQHRLQELVDDFIEEIYAAFAAPQLGVPNKHLDRMSSIFDERYPRVDDWRQISSKLMEAISLVRGMFTELMATRGM